MFKVYDISMTIREDMPVYKNKESKRPSIRTVQDFATAASFESRISLDAHCGTHLDAPLHMIDGGETIETIPLEDLIGPCRVLDLTHVEEGIGKKELEAFNVQPGEWVLLKTKNSFSETFDPQFVYLTADGARYLAGRRIKGVGTDGLGIERSQPDHGTHLELFRHRIHIVEGLRLKEVPAGNYFMVIAPLKLTGIEAAPARALLIGSGQNE